MRSSSHSGWFWAQHSGTWSITSFLTAPQPRAWGLQEWTHTHAEPVVLEMNGQNKEREEARNGQGERNGIWEQWGMSSPAKEAEKAEHLKTAIKGSWGESEMKKKQLESNQEKWLNRYLPNKDHLGNRHGIYLTLGFLWSFSASATLQVHEQGSRKHINSQLYMSLLLQVPPWCQQDVCTGMQDRPWSSCTNCSGTGSLFRTIHTYKVSLWDRSFSSSLFIFLFPLILNFLWFSPHIPSTETLPTLFLH